MALTCQPASRIADSSGSWQAACAGDVTDWDKANEFIVATYALSDSVNPDSDFKMQWRRAGGTFADVGSDTEVCWGTNTVLVDGDAVANPAVCRTPVDDDVENEGDNLAHVDNIANGEYCEIQWALGFGSGALGEQEYELQLVSIDWENSAILNSSITTAAAAEVLLQGTSDGVATADADIIVYKWLVATSGGVAGVTSDLLRVTKALAATSDGACDVPAVLLKKTVPIQGTSDGVATADGNLTRDLALFATSDGLAGAEGVLRGIWALKGTSDGVATADGALTIAGAIVTLTGTSDGVATVAGLLTGTWLLHGASDGVATASSSLSPIRGLLGTSDGVATSQGALVATIGLVGTADGIATANGVLGLLVELLGTSDGIATTIGVLSSIRRLAASRRHLDFSTKRALSLTAQKRLLALTTEKED